MNKFALILALGSVAIASQAQTFSFNTAPVGTNNEAGVYKNVKGSFNKSTKEFNWSGTFGKDVDGNKTDGYWLVVSNGADPKTTSGQLSIMYLDASNTSNVKLTVYGYNGVNGDTSYKDGNGQGGAPSKIKSSVFDKSWVKSLTAKDNADGTRTLGFDIDGSSIQNYGNASTGWTGLSFGGYVGVWMHAVSGLSTDYSSGYLTKFEYDHQGWWDQSYVHTSSVFEPCSIAALALGGAFLARRRRKLA